MLLTFTFVLIFVHKLCILCIGLRLTTCVLSGYPDNTHVCLLIVVWKQWYSRTSCWACPQRLCF